MSPFIHVWVRFVMPATIEPGFLAIVERELWTGVSGVACIPTHCQHA